MVYLPKMSPERIGNIDNKSRLIVYRQEDGDVIVEILQDDQGQIKRASVEFCTIESGGGQSPRTFEALVKLIEAIKEDNKKDRFATTPTITEKKSLSISIQNLNSSPGLCSFLFLSKYLLSRCFLAISYLALVYHQ